MVSQLSTGKQASWRRPPSSGKRLKSTAHAFPRNAGQRSAATDTALESWQTIARTYAQHALYEEAAQLFEDAMPLAGATLPQRVAIDFYDFNAICLRLRCGDTEAYRRMCASLDEQLAESRDEPVIWPHSLGLRNSPRKAVSTRCAFWL